MQYVFTLRMALQCWTAPNIRLRLHSKDEVLLILSHSQHLNGSNSNIICLELDGDDHVGLDRVRLRLNCGL
jgi:hypothetical protein